MSEYDLKLKEMKSYIPFLDGMIEKLEKEKTGNREAQLTKIRALRELLLDDSKRMKMDNLIKCEIVLKNLYNKVEQNSILPNKDARTIEPDLQVVREKLKIVTKTSADSNSSEANPDYLETVIKSEPDLPQFQISEKRKECNLFQRRPARDSRSVSVSTVDSAVQPVKSPGAVRKYTRVLISPEPSPPRWNEVTPSEREESNDMLFKRRSPRSQNRTDNRSKSRYRSKSRHRSKSRGGGSHKKEKRKTKRSSPRNKSNLRPKTLIDNVDISLDIPEEALGSLNSSDLLERILSCNEDDVDIEKLRALRAQIVRELQVTSASQDISDLIMKSYRRKTKSMRKEEVEEGELLESDSESLEKIYGNLTVEVKNEHQGVESNKVKQTKALNEDPLPRIKIRLTIGNTEDKKSTGENTSKEKPACSEMKYQINSDKLESSLSSNDIAKEETANMCQNSELNESLDTNLKKDDNDLSANTSESQKVQNQNNCDNISSEEKERYEEKQNKSDEVYDNPRSQTHLPVMPSPSIRPLKSHDNSPKKKPSEKDGFYSNPPSDLKNSSYGTHAAKKQNKESEAKLNEQKINSNHLIQSEYKTEQTAENTERTDSSKSSLDINNKSLTDNTTKRENTYSRINTENQDKLQSSTRQSSKNTENQDKLQSSTRQSSKNTENQDKLQSSTRQSSKNTEICIPFIEKVDSKTFTMKESKQQDVSEVDILQALRDEIVSKAIEIPSADTPALHVPKLTKVIDKRMTEQESQKKKRISIEKYKEKAPQRSLLINKKNKKADDSSRKLSKALTQKEFQRFQSVLKTLDDSSDEEITIDPKSPASSISASDIYGDLGPESPEAEPSVNAKPPVIIPSEPLRRQSIINQSKDNLQGKLQTNRDNTLNLSTTRSNSPSFAMSNFRNPDADEMISKSDTRFGSLSSSRPMTPRSDRYSNAQNININPRYDMTPRPDSTPKWEPNSTPNPSGNVTPQTNMDNKWNVSFPVSSNYKGRNPKPLIPYNTSSLGNNTRNVRTYEMTPSHAFECESEGTKRKHVYAPSDVPESETTCWESSDVTEKMAPQEPWMTPRPESMKTVWDIHERGSCTPRNDPSYVGVAKPDRDPRRAFDRRSDPRLINQLNRDPRAGYDKRNEFRNPDHPSEFSSVVECPRTPSHPFGRSEGCANPRVSDSRECPPTPSHPFGRSEVYMECPPTPSHSFGRSETYMECPPTPNHSFGRTDTYMECPPTPIHPFGRSETFMECPSTPSHPFGRTEKRNDTRFNPDFRDCPRTPNTSFGRSELFSECPSTPSHLFGRIDARKDPRCNPDFRTGSSTPSHSFTRSESYIECPSTPIHPFGRSDSRLEKPTTPIHPFGRTPNATDRRVGPERRVDPRLDRLSQHTLECPRTPSHPFGRSSGNDLNNSCDTPMHIELRPLLECPSTPSHPFGRTSNGDSRKLVNVETAKNLGLLPTPPYNQKTQDARSDPDGLFPWENRKIFDEQRDSRRSSQNRTNIENERFVSQAYSRPLSVAHNYKRASSVGRTLIKDPNSEKSLTSYRCERAQSIGRERAQSIGRERAKSTCRDSVPYIDFKRAISLGRERAMSVGPEKNKSMDIDRSNFQSRRDLHQKEQLSSTDNRRSLVRDNEQTVRHDEEKSICREREKSVGREKVSNLSTDDKRRRGGEYCTQREGEKSIARDSEKSKLKDREKSIARDGEKSRARERENSIGSERQKSSSQQSSKNKNSRYLRDLVPKNYQEISIKERDSRLRSRKDPHERTKDHRASEKRYFRDNEKASKRDTKYKHSNSTHHKLDASYGGIVYTNDNIASGHILGKGYGVKNYKIPKLKREPEKPPEKIIESKEIPNFDTQISHVSELSDASEGCLLADDDTKKGSSFIDASVEKRDEVDTDNELKIVSKKNNRISIFDSDSENEDGNDLIESALNSLDNAELLTLEAEDSLVSKLVESPSLDQRPKESLPSVKDDCKRSESNRHSNTENVSTEKDIPNSKKSNTDYNLEITTIDNQTSLSSSFSSRESIAVSSEAIKQSSSSDKPSISENIRSLNDDMVISNNENSNNTEFEKPATPISFELSKTSNTVPTAADSTVPADDDSNNAFGDSTCIQEGTATNDKSVMPSQADVVSSSQTSKDSMDNTHNNLCKTQDVGELLSILQNRSKLLEILGMLDDKSEESKKIKKKLSKLTEFESDDENESTVNENEPTVNENKTTVNENEPTVTENEATVNENVCLVNENVSTVNENEPIVKDNEPTLNEIQPMLNENELSVHADKHPVQENHTLDTVTDINSSKISLTATDELKTKITESNHSEINAIQENNGVDFSNEFQTKKADTTPQIKPTKGRKSSNKKTKVPIRITRSTVNRKPRNRELQKLHDDIREMFISDEVLNASGLRMCRLAKLVEETDENCKNQTKRQNKISDTDKSEKTLTEPVVILEKSQLVSADLHLKTDTKSIFAWKKRGPKPKWLKKLQAAKDEETIPKSDNLEETVEFKLKKRNEDQYEFDDRTSLADSSDDESLSSFISHSSKGENVDHEGKKPKRKKTWKHGVVPKTKKKKITAIIQNCDDISVSNTGNTSTVFYQNKIIGEEYLTDKSYAFEKGRHNYKCFVCDEHDLDIVSHFKEMHPHAGVPISKLSQLVAEKAIAEASDTNFEDINRSMRFCYRKRITCRFCFRVFKLKSLQPFFQHLVLKHTGEYKSACVECTDKTSCPASIHIPIAPLANRSLILGYICIKCHYTQISMENIKKHVMVHHFGEAISIVKINLSENSNETNPQVEEHLDEDQSSDAAEQSACESSGNIEKCDDKKDSNNKTEIEKFDSPKKVEVFKLLIDKAARSPKTNLMFEDDLTAAGIDTSRISCNSSRSIVFEEDSAIENIVKTENMDPDELKKDERQGNTSSSQNQMVQVKHENIDATLNADKKPVFLVSSKKNNKEYICCINESCFYRTTLMISLKKHVQFKHKEDVWDGYCKVCDSIVPTASDKTYKHCLQHYIDSHMDDFPILTEIDDPIATEKAIEKPAVGSPSLQESAISVKPLSQLMSPDKPNGPDFSDKLPRIENVISLSQTDKISSELLPQGEMQILQKVKVEPGSWEATQAAILSSKHRAIRDTMLAPDKLANTFKCAGMYCSFTSNKPGSFVVHIQAHVKRKPAARDIFRCIYCPYESDDNAIDLTSHIFREHGHCGFACSKCFYLAAFNSSVTAHSLRIHPESDHKILQFTPANSNLASATSEVLAPNVAVLPYECTVGRDVYNVARPSACHFVTYTSAKFLEHLDAKHEEESVYTCSMCGESSFQSGELLRHYERHALCLYQCAFCCGGGRGAHSKAEMLAHLAAAHPAKKPQAYLRHILDSKDSEPGKTKMIALPLIALDQIRLPTTQVEGTDSCDADKEAARAAEFEQLMCPVDDTDNKEEPLISYGLPEPSAPEVSPIVVLPPTDPLAQAGITAPEQDVESDPLGNSGTAEASSRRASTQSAGSFTPQSLGPNMATIVSIKKEANDTESRPTTIDDHIICLDSDDDCAIEPAATKAPQQEVIDLSLEDDTPPEDSVRVARTQIHKCANCVMSFKELDFRIHVRQCFPDGVLQCGFCAYRTRGYKDLKEHLSKFHAPIRRYHCSMCRYNSNIEKKTVQHMFQAHNVKNVGTVYDDASTLYNVKYTIRPEAVKPEAVKLRAPKKKQGAAEARPQESAKRFGPNDALPMKEIFDDLVSCALCEFKTKVKCNLQRHLQSHASQVPVPTAEAVNPVPHLDTNEMHFDKMTNLALSSNPTKQAERRVDPPASQLNPSEISKYPKFVPDRSRNACGALGCSYISIDEDMLKYHWDTLHNEVTTFRCIHCPPNQKLDTTKPLTSARIISHLKMHDARLYVCSTYGCNYYHYNMHLVEKHQMDKHNLQRPVHVLREPAMNPSSTDSRASAMDLKPWQCGLCKYKSMLRPEVVEHSFKSHLLKFQYKCAFCAWGSVSLDNVIKHHETDHPGKEGNVVHVYYRQGMMPNDKAGRPFWMKQREDVGSSLTSSVKAEELPATALQMAPAESETPARKPNSSPNLANIAPVPVDLNLVKSEVEETKELDLQELMIKYGEHCDPKGDKYLCPLCKDVRETKEGLISHLYEELNYRRWSCAICSYKAFHKIGLMEHTFHEHKQTQEPVELAPDQGMELWMQKLVEHQETILQSRQEPQQEEMILPDLPEPAASADQLSQQTTAGTVEGAEAAPGRPDSGSKQSMQVLEQTFGSFGAPYGLMYSCPKCDFKVKDENKMAEHLEMELAKVRWSCSGCACKFQQFHEARRHCASSHPACFTQVLGVSRDAGLRAAWLHAVIQVQKLTMNCMPVRPETPQASVPDEEAGPSQAPETDAVNDLLVVRYAETVTPTDERPVRRKRPVSLAEQESDEDAQLVIDEPAPKPSKDRKCPHCDFTPAYAFYLEDHVYKHFGMKAYKCGYCDFEHSKSLVSKHLKELHGHCKKFLVKNKLPDGPPTVPDIRKRAQKTPKKDTPKPAKVSNLPESMKNIDSLKFMSNAGPDSQLLVCLKCDKAVTSEAMKEHLQIAHIGEVPQIASKGDVVYKCASCLVLRKDLDLLKKHYASHHSQRDVNYTLFRIGSDKRETISCGHCPLIFKFIKDLRCHHQRAHHSLQMAFSRRMYTHATDAPPFPSGPDSATDDSGDLDDILASETHIRTQTDQPVRQYMAHAGSKRPMLPATSVPAKRVARKSTTKLPFSMRVTARKSTTKLPYSISLPESDEEDFSFYGTRPVDVSTLGPIRTEIPVWGTLMPFTLKQLSDKFNLYPKIELVDCIKNAKK